MNTRIPLTILLLVVGGTCNFSSAAELPGYEPGAGVDEASLEQICRWALEEYKVPGTAVAVVRDGKPFFAAGFGVRDLDSGEPVTEDTIFQLASVSKTFAAAAVAAMVDEGKLQWEQPAAEVLPSFAMHEAYATRWVNARDFLVHRAGFPGFFGDLFDHLGYSRPDIIHRIRFVKPGYSFRDHPEYSNIGFFLAGEMAAAAAGAPFDEIVRSRIFEPLGMKRSGVASVLFSDDDNISRSHAGKEGSLRVVPSNLSAVFIAAGGLASSASDLSDYLVMLANGGESGGRRILSPEAVHAIFEPVIAEEPGFAEFPPIDGNSGFDYTPGWGVYHYNGLRILEKGGALDGIRTILVLVPQKKFGIAVLANRNLTALPEAIRAAILQREFGRDGEEDLQPAIREKSHKIEELLLAPQERPENPAPPAHPLEAYTGVFTNDLFGQWEIAVKDAALEVIAGPARYHGALTPWDGEVFHLLWPGVISAPVDVRFAVDDRKRIVSFDCMGYEFRRVGE
ncbi:MAG: serine hydrolase [Chthoniobacterales bacterium]|nr:serine hydrolase [Chthoniobacterales bacterium]